MSYYILSIKWSKGEDAVWWGPNDSGYAKIIENAGVYTEEQVRAKPHYYDNGTSTKAIPVAEVEKRVKRLVRFEDLRDLGAQREWEIFPPAEEEEDDEDDE